ncbi:enhancer of filamentation 1 [Megalops cyprinoides]|uniref:enhancer of filamentation 1 n=1 Tax=Megalops cyprinoides TaxID=118141 RepID=UPI001864460D|nr:enhancer of filamentation 1 [Megalops cyprinoides]
MKYKNLMAKALYDNVPESPEELAFRKGDILTVIEQNTGGLEGWWLCSLHGRQGIAPGNRLKLLIGPMFEAQTPASQAPPSGPAYQQKPGSAQGSLMLPPSHQSPQQQGVYQVPPGKDLYQVPQGKDLYQVPQRSPWAADGTASKVVTPMRVGQSYTYEPTQSHQQDVYDVPPVRPQGVYDIPAGKQGLAFPGKLGDPRMQGLYDIPPTTQGVYDIPPTTQGVYDIPPTTQGVYDIPPTTQGVYDIPPTTQGVYSVPPCRNNPIPQEGNYDFPQPLKVKPGDVYDVPPASLARPSAQSNYDFPPSSEPAPHRGAAHGHGSVYDVPPQLSAGPQGDVYDIPRGTQSGGRGGGDYDVPPQEPRPLGDVTDGVNRLSISSTGSARSSMSTSSSASSSAPEPRGGPDLDSALQRLGQLQQAVEAAVSTLLALAASPHWRTPQFMERRLDEVQGTLERVRGSLTDLLVFGRVTAASALTLSDRSLQAKLRRQLQRLEDSQQILLQSGHTLEASSKPQGRCDDLDRFVMVSRTLPDDVKQLASTVSGSAELLFRRAAAAPNSLPQGVTPDGRHPGNTGPAPDNEIYDEQLERDQTAPFPVPPGLQLEKDNLNHSEKCVKSWMEDYDYVHLQGKEEFERQQKELLEKENITKQSKIQLEQEQLNQFKQLEREVSKPVENDISQWITHQQTTAPSSSSSSSLDSSSSQGGGSQLCGWDRQLLCFYSEQCESHFITLLNAVDAFFGCISAGQPPRIFVAHSKFVILSAHKLVFVGDTLSRQASSPQLAGRVMNCSNALCELLKTVVGATKTAALHYPNTAALQEMVDRVTDLSHQAQQFKAQLLQMASS